MIVIEARARAPQLRSVADGVTRKTYIGVGCGYLRQQRMLPCSPHRCPYGERYEYDDRIQSVLNSDHDVEAIAFVSDKLAWSQVSRVDCV